MNDIRSLSHSKWRCKYHIVFAPKYRRQVIYKKLKADIGRILRELCERKGVNIVEAECCSNHIHWTIVNKKDTIFKYIFWEWLDSLPIPESCFHFVWCQIA